MKSKHSNSKIRPLGQRSLPSTLLFRPHPPNQIRSGDAKEGSRSGPPLKAKSVSFSDYLNRKLHSSAVVPRPLQLPSDGKSHSEEPNHCERRGQQKGTNGLIEESVFKQFNLGCAGQENEQSRAIHGTDDEVEAVNIANTTQGCRKRRNAFKEFAVGNEGSTVQSRLFILGDDASNRKDTAANNGQTHLCNEGNTASKETQPAIKKRLVVLGDDPKPKRGTHRRNSFSSKETKPQYNHYKNGAGWWDYEREGVDNDEVGANEVWEGVGSTTLGEIVDWH